MRVGIDVSPLAQTRAGTARYLRALLARNEYVQLGLPGTSRLATVMRDALWYPLALPREARKHNLDVLHCPTFRAPFFSTPMPLVVTVLDLAVLRHPGMFNQWSRRYSRFAVPRVVQAADAVITISEFTRSEVVGLLGAPPEKVHAIPIAVEAPFTAEGRRAEGDYVLAVGTLEPRKNLARVVEAARRLGAELRVVGARGWGGVSAGGAGVTALGEVPDEELAALYRGAQAVAYPSLYEGFGLPVLEAMACGAPVVTSRGGATEELAGDAALLVDPLDPAAIAAGLEEAIRRREELQLKGLARALSFSWDRVARETWAVYEQVAA